MLKDRRQLVRKIAARRLRFRQLVPQYGAFLRTLFEPGDWFVTLTFRDRRRDLEMLPKHACVLRKEEPRTRLIADVRRSATRCPPDPRLAAWKPDSRYRREPGPPVKDEALREIWHWLLWLGWEAAGRTRQEIFERLAEGLFGRERRAFARRLSTRCLLCEAMKDPMTFSLYCEVQMVATRTIGWVVAEELGRVGGRWHVHILIRGVQHLRRKKWWRRAFVRFGRTRIEPIRAQL